jgi:hypothetical protein
MDITFVNLACHTRISLEKIDVASNPISPTTRWDEWIAGGLENQGSLPISYSLKGYLMSPIRCGHAMEVCRVERNGVKAFGVFHSTPVVEIRPDGLIETYNSIYRVTYEANSTKEAR